MLADGRAEVVLVNNTDARINDTMAIFLCKHAESGAALPSAWFSAFKVQLLRVDGQTRVVVDWA